MHKSHRDVSQFTEQAPPGGDHPNILVQKFLFYLYRSLLFLFYLSLVHLIRHSAFRLLHHRVIVQPSSKSQPHITGVDPARSNTSSN